LDNFILTIIIAAILSLLFSTLIGRLLYKSDLPSSLLDIPNKRKIHTRPTPLVGGITIIFSMLLVIILLQLYTVHQTQQFIIFSLYFLFVGLFDDLFRWDYKKKLILQVIGIILFIISISSNISQLTLFSIHSDYILINHVIVFFWLLFIINAFNFFDGANFLAGSLAVVFFSSYAIYYFQAGGNLPFVLLIVLIFSIIGFLTYNRAPAKMFLGDAGSMFLGFALASFGIIFQSSTHNSLNMTFPVIVLFILISDTIFVIVNRIKKGESPFYPDKTHLHHQFLNLKYRNRYIVLIILVGAILHSILAFQAFNMGLLLLLSLLVLINIIFIVLPRFLPTLFERYNLWGLKNIYDNIIKYIQEK